jgi:hypothetical protein
VSAAIAEQSELLKSRIGAAAYALTANKVLVKRAEKCLAAAEMTRLRLQNLSDNAVDGEVADGKTQHLKSTADDWDAKAEQMITKIIDGATSDSGGFAVGCSVSEPTRRLSVPSC